MTPNRPRDPETQWDQHHPSGHPRPREAKSQNSQLKSDVVHGGSKSAKRQLSAKMGVPGSADRTDYVDLSIGETVQKLLDQDANLKVYGLEADVVDGVVRVNGIVDTLADKRYVVEAIKGIPGVQGLEDGISLSTDGKITDRGAEMEAAEELSDIPNLRRKVGVKVTDGVAYLLGTVESKEEEAQAIEAASKARGVISIVSQIKVRPTGVNRNNPHELFHSQVRNDPDSLG